MSSGVQALIVDSEAQVHRTAAGNGVKSGHYQNVVEVEAAGTPAAPTSSIQEVRITGDAKTELKGAGLASLKYVDASGSGGGVTVDATADNDGTGTAATNVVTLIGSNRKDVFMASNIADGTSMNKLSGNGGDDELTGGTGKDSLNGGAGGDKLKGFAGATETTATRDLFVYNAASDSQVSFKEQEDGSFKEQGYDIITGFDSGPATETTADRIVVSKTLFAALAGNIKNTAAEWDDWMRVDTDGTTGGDDFTATTFIDGDANEGVAADATAIPPVVQADADGGAKDLYSFIGNGKGLFRSREIDADRAADTNPTGIYTAEYSMAVVEQDSGIRNTVDAGDGTWVLFDVDGDGDFDAGTDMVIFLAGVLSADGSGDSFIGADLMSA